VRAPPALPFYARGEAPLIGVYTRSGDLAIEGGPSALQSLARAVREAPSSLALSHPAEKGPEPYDGFLDVVLVTASAGKVAICRREKTLVITGDTESRALLAANIDSLASEALESNHLHVEYYTDHFYLSASTAALVVERRDA
jgi:hypothetical protein